MSPAKPGQEELQEIASRVELLVFDVDGTLTDGGMLYGPAGEALKRFDVRDGLGMMLAHRAGLKVALLSARTSEIVNVRARELKVGTVYQGRLQKLPALHELLQEVGVAATACAYMGDDVNDLGPLGHVALPACPADAVAEARKASLFIAQNRGGRGAARELIELCLKASNRWTLHA